MTDIYFDGGCKPNPGMMEAAIVVVYGPGKHEARHERLEYGTNNEAEWLAALWGLMRAQELGLETVVLKGDSQLVVNQAQGKWSCKKRELQVYLEEFKKLRTAFKSVNVVYVPRADNLAGQHIEAVN